MSASLLVFLKNDKCRYLCAGGFMVGYGFGLNIFLVEICHFYTAISYGIVLISQLCIGFFLNRYWVFSKGKLGLNKLFSRYVGLSLVFRCIDWAIFVLQVDFFSIYYIIAQLINYSIFVPLKYYVWRFLFRFEDNKTTDGFNGP